PNPGSITPGPDIGTPIVHKEEKQVVSSPSDGLLMLKLAPNPAYKGYTFWPIARSRSDWAPGYLTGWIWGFGMRNDRDTQFPRPRNAGKMTFSQWVTGYGPDFPLIEFGPAPVAPGSGPNPVPIQGGSTGPTTLACPGDSGAA